MVSLLFIADSMRHARISTEAGPGIVTNFKARKATFNQGFFSGKPGQQLWQHEHEPVQKKKHLVLKERLKLRFLDEHLGGFQLPGRLAEKTPLPWVETTRLHALNDLIIPLVNYNVVASAGVHI